MMTTLLLAFMLGIALAEDSAMTDVGARAANVAMAQLGVEMNDPDLLAMTDASYSMIEGKTTEAAIDGVSEATGCTIGKANLLIIHRSKFNPLWFFFFDKESGEAVFLQVREEAATSSAEDLEAMSDEEVFSIISKEQISADYMLENAEEWNQKFDEKVFGGNEFSLTTIANIWAHPEVSYDFLQAACLHNHLCPGVSSGYFILNYVEKKLPITDPVNQSYKVIACPVWCKEDAFQAIWDATPGKGGLFVKGLTGENRAALPDYAKDAAGIYIRWDSSTSTGDGLVVGSNSSKVKELYGIEACEGPWCWWTSRLESDLAYMEYQGQPEIACSTIMEFEVDQNNLTQLQEAGVNPYVHLGIVA